jgi:hypothetical protein
MRPMRIASTNIIAPRSTAATQITDRLLVTSANAPNTSMPIGAEAFPSKNITESTRPLIDSGVRVAIAVCSGMLANIRAIPQTSIPPYKRYGDASRQPPIIASDAASMKRLETIRCSRRNFGVQTDCNSEAVRIPMLQRVSAIARLFTPRWALRRNSRMESPVGKQPRLRLHADTSTLLLDPRTPFAAIRPL